MVHGMHKKNTEKVEDDEELFWKSTCCICYEKFAVEVKTKCNHKFCSCCVTQICNHARYDGSGLKCPWCRGDLTYDVLEYEFTLHNINLAELSTKNIQNAFPTLPLCSNATIDDISKWLQYDIDVNYVNDFTALTSAAIKGNLNVLEFLITNGANVESTTIFGKTPLIVAAIYGHVDIIETLLKQKAEVNKKDLHGFSAIHYAALKIGNVEITKLFIESGEILDIDTPTNQGFSALHLTSVYGDLESMKILIKNGANVNKLNEIIAYGAPLHLVAHFGHLNLFKYLISETKVDINLPTSTGATPLMFAISGQKFDLVEALLKEKAEVNAQMNDGCSALHLATANIKIVEILIEHGADINMRSDIHKTPMIQAAGLGHLDVVQYLIEKKADINVSTINGETPLMAAAGQGHFEIVKELLKANPELPVLKQQCDGQSVLSLAELNGHTLITEFLCEIVDVQNKDEISTCVNTIFTNLYQHELLEDDDDIDEQNKESSTYVNKMFLKLKEKAGEVTTEEKDKLIKYVMKKNNQKFTVLYISALKEYKGFKNLLLSAFSEEEKDKLIKDVMKENDQKFTVFYISALKEPKGFIKLLLSAFSEEEKDKLIEYMMSQKLKVLQLLFSEEEKEKFNKILMKENDKINVASFENSQFGPWLYLKDIKE